MESATVKITRNRMRELSRQGQKAAARRNLELANDALAISKGLVPVDEGDLKSTLRVEQEARTGAASLIAGGIPGKETGKDVSYAQFVEWGTATAPAQPFMKPAVELAVKRSRNRSFRMYR